MCMTEPSRNTYKMLGVTWYSTYYNTCMCSSRIRIQFACDLRILLLRQAQMPVYWLVHELYLCTCACWCKYSFARYIHNWRKLMHIRTWWVEQIQTITTPQSKIVRGNTNTRPWKLWPTHWASSQKQRTNKCYPSDGMDDHWGASWTRLRRLSPSYPRSISWASNSLWSRKVIFNRPCLIRRARGLVLGWTCEHMHNPF